MISIILPNLNTPITFLRKRLETIFKQTNTDWECVVIDGYSINGSWEYIRNATEKDVRFKLYQLPKKGIYNAWNEGIKRTKGEFIYVATSDDTMSSELLQKMSLALIANEDCGFCNCGLTIIDENDNPVEHPWEKYWTSEYFGPLLNQKHKRLAPHDGLLHMGVQTVYTSITQLLIRKSLFDKIGLFLTNAGTIADFEWGMRASLLTNVLYIPEKLATWRIHKEQATTESYNNTSKHRKKLCQLANTAFSIYNKKSGLQAEKQFNMKKLFYVFKRDQFIYELREEKRNSKKIGVFYKWSASHFRILVDVFLFKLRLKKFNRVKYIRNYIKSLAFDKNIIFLK